MVPHAAISDTADLSIEQLIAEWPYSPGTSPYRVKGIVCDELWAWVESHSERQELLASLPPSYGEYLGAVTQRQGWYDVFPHFVLSVLASQRSGRSWRGGVETRARYFAQRDRSSVVKLMMTMVSPSTVLRATPLLIGRYFSYGMARVDVERGAGLLRVNSLPGPLLPWHGQMARSYLLEALRAVGGRELDVSIEARDAGLDPRGVAMVHMLVHLRWQ